MGQLSRCALLWLVLLVLAGCASGPQKPEELASSHGYVQAYLPKIGYESQLAIRNVSTGKEYWLQPDAESDLAVAGLWVPAGEYRLSRWVDTHLRDWPAFRVEERRVTSLGALIPISLGASEMTLLSLRTPEVAAAVSAGAERFRPHLRTSAPIEWSMDLPKPFGVDPGITGLGLVADMLVLLDQHINQTPIGEQLRRAPSPADLLAVARRAAAPSNREPAVDRDGNLYYPAVLGQVRVRTPNGAWSSLDTGTLRSISSVEWRPGLLLAGSDDGLLRASKDGGRTWKVVAALGKRKAVTDIDWAGSHLIVLTAGYSPHIGAVNKIDGVEVHVATQDDLSDLKLVFRDAKEEPLHFAPNWSAVRGEFTGKSYLFPSFGKLMKLDLGSLRVSGGPPLPYVTSFAVFPPTGMVTATLAAGGGSRVHVSTDHGESWTRVAEPSLVIEEVVFETPEKGHAARLPPAAFTPILAFETYDAASRQWVAKDSAPRGCRSVLQDAHRLPSFCVTGSGSILRRARQGWVIEFSAE